MSIFNEFICAKIDSSQAAIEQKWLGALQHGSQGKNFYRGKVEAKEGNYLIGCSLSVCLLWKSLVGCL